MTNTRVRLLTVQDVAEILQVSQSCIYAWVADGFLPSVVMNRRGKKALIRFRPEAIEEFIRQREQEHRDFIDRRNSEKEDFRKKVAHLTRKLDG
ncbi:MAG: helix-turn-helix domain-containing protein [Deltaproteobacteria bacterium]|nr:helix-turn-helix domain-containing protein [Deltaproteobacteria bacterium]